MILRCSHDLGHEEVSEIIIELPQNEVKQIHPPTNKTKWKDGRKIMTTNKFSKQSFRWFFLERKGWDQQTVKLRVEGNPDFMAVF